MNYDKKCKWHKSCGYDFCHGEGICPEFEKGKPPCSTAQECIYCGHQKLEKMDKLEPEESEAKKDD